MGFVEYANFDETVKRLEKIETQLKNAIILNYKESYLYKPREKRIFNKEQLMFRKHAKLYRENVKFLDGIYSGQYSKTPFFPHGFGIFIQNETGALYEGWRKFGLRWGHGR
jgi:hypothetical protein